MPPWVEFAASLPPPRLFAAPPPSSGSTGEGLVSPAAPLIPPPSLPFADSLFLFDSAFGCTLPLGLAGSCGRHHRYSHLHCVKAERFQARWLDAMRSRRRCLLAFIAPCGLFCLLFDAALVKLCSTGSRAAPAGTSPYYRQPVQGTVGRQYASPQSALTCCYSLGESRTSLLTRLPLVLSPRDASPQASRGIVVSLFCCLNLRASATVGPTTSRTRRLLSVRPPRPQPTVGSL
jgi:hypothetical protein